MGDTTANHMNDPINALLQRGFELPLYVACISANGSVLVGRYEAGDTRVEFRDLLEHRENDVFTLPVNMMVVDARGEAARVVIRSDGTQYLH
jgi:hypothetical protein